MMLEELRSDLSQWKALEIDLSAANWNDEESSSSSSSSPRGVVDTSLVQRYQAARDLYLQRRMEKLLVEHVGTFDGTTFEFPENNDDDDDDDQIQERHSQALATLQTSVHNIQQLISQRNHSYQTVCQERQELEQMVQDMEKDEEEDDDDDDDDDSMILQEEDMALEQEQILQLQHTKKRLQEEWAKMQQETIQAQERIRQNRHEMALLEQPQEDPEQLQQKVQELQEMKLFYDSLKEVLEELGGVKILEVQESSKQPQHNMHLTILLYDEYKVQIELAVHRQTALKVVQAQWITPPVIQQQETDFSLEMEPLDDLVNVAKATLGPPHDLRFLIREALARIRIHQHRCQDLAVLRQQVLTKIHKTEVVCSLNDGIVICMRFYDPFVRVEQIVGVSGWTQEHTDQISKAIVQDENTTPSSIVQQVQKEIAKRIEQGVVQPQTPTMPKRKEGN